MTPNELLTPSAEATPQQAAEFAAMQRMFIAAHGSFSLSFAVCNSPALRDYLIRRVQESIPGIAVVSLTKDAVDPYGFVVSQLNSRVPEALCVVDLERIVPSESEGQPALRSLNASRELWAQRFHCPIVFWMPEYASALLSTHARDFYRYRSHRFEFVSEFATASAGIMDYNSGNLSAASRLSKDEKQFRVAELEQRLSDAGDSPDPALRLHILNWLNELAWLQFDLGELDDAESLWQRMENLARRSRSEFGQATAYGNLGIVMRTRGDLDGAEAMHRKALEIDEKLGWLDAMANAYGNLGNIMQTRGDLGRAEATYRKALEIDEKLGRLEGMAISYGNLGTIMQIRGDLDEAEAMYRQALRINEKLGRLEGVANEYGHLGSVMGTRGDLVEAEAMLRKALEIDEKLGRLEGMANAYANLGRVMHIRGNLDEAREYWTKALDLFARLGALHLVDKVHAWIDNLAK